MESRVISLDEDSQRLDFFYNIEEGREDKCRTLKGDDVNGLNGRYYRNSSAFREKGMHPSSFPPFRPFSTTAVLCPGEKRTEIPAFAYQGTATV